MRIYLELQENRDMEYDEVPEISKEDENRIYGPKACALFEEGVCKEKD